MPGHGERTSVGLAGDHARRHSIEPERKEF
jgi:hypothetical protein